MRNLSFSFLLGLYFISGISLTCYNKYLLSFWGFKFPVTLIFCHMITNCCLAGFSVYCCCSDSPLRNSPFYPTNITRKMFIRKFVPIGLLFGLDITLSTVSMEFISVSLVEVVKSAVPALLFLAQLVRGKDHTPTFPLRLAKVLNVILICMGVGFTAAGESNFEIRGFVAAMGATIAATMKLVTLEDLLSEEVPTTVAAANADENASLNGPSSIVVSSTKTVRVASKGSSGGPSSSSSSSAYDQVQGVDENDAESGISPPTSTLTSGSSNVVRVSAAQTGSHHGHSGKLHPILSLFYFTPVSAMALLPVQLYLESSKLGASRFAAAGQWEPTILIILLGSIVAFGLNSSELLVIAETSALTLCIFGVLKFLIIMVVSIFLFDYKITALNRAGLVLATLGLIVYNYVRFKEDEIRRALHVESERGGASSPRLQQEAMELDVEAASEDEERNNLKSASSLASPSRYVKKTSPIAINSTLSYADGGINSSTAANGVKRRDAKELDSEEGSTSSSSAGSVDGLLETSKLTAASPSKRHVNKSAAIAADEDSLTLLHDKVAATTDIGERLIHALKQEEDEDFEDSDVEFAAHNASRK